MFMLDISLRILIIFMSLMMFLGSFSGLFKLYGTDLHPIFAFYGIFTGIIMMYGAFSFNTL
jgi:hypothetical protein